MGYLDAWTIVTGAASIISLFISLSDRFPTWHRYIRPFGYSLGGFAIGRVTAGSSQAASESIQDPRFIGLVMILIPIFIILYLFLHVMVKRKQDFYAYFMTFMVLIIGVPQVMDKYFEAFPLIPKEDYLLLEPVAKPHKHFLNVIMAQASWKKATNILI